MTKVLLRALKSIRPPVGGMFNPPDIFGEEEQIARRLIKEGSAELWDGGKGAGVILTSAENGLIHEREPWETDAMWAARGGKPRAAQEAKKG